MADARERGEVELSTDRVDLLRGFCRRLARNGVEIFHSSWELVYLLWSRVGGVVVMTLLEFSKTFRTITGEGSFVR